VSILPKHFLAEEYVTYIWQCVYHFWKWTIWDLKHLSRYIKSVKDISWIANEKEARETEFMYCRSALERVLNKDVSADTYTSKLVLSVAFLAANDMCEFWLISDIPP